MRKNEGFEISASLRQTWAEWHAQHWRDRDTDFLASIIMVIMIAALVFLVAGCAGVPTPAVPDRLRPATNEYLLKTVAAKGVQIYECRAVKDRSAAYAWAFVAPEADLFDAAGNKVGKHYAGPHWEAADGSKIKGAVKESSAAPVENAIPWLLLSATSDGPAGAFSRITSVQRVNTVGGMAPKGACSEASAGATVRVPYSADYYFYTARAAY
jgi:hypothetical protein